jgi:CDP-diacylglycerol---glycerol-3-phosphate 3-phosphatidyltransferase
MEVAYALLMPIARFAAARKVSPNLFSWGCFAIGLGSGIGAALSAIPLAGALSLAAGCCDILDGMVARLEGIASDAGEMLDAVVDRYSELFFLSGLCIAYRHSVAGLILVQGALVGSLLVSYSQAKAEAMVVSIARGWMRRPERVSYLGVGAILSMMEPRDPLLIALALVAIFANLTAARRFVTMYATLRNRPAAAAPLTLSAPEERHSERVA